MAYYAALLHEFAHYAVCILCGVKPICLKIGIFGINLRTEYITETKKKIFISIAGPIFSFALAGLFFLLGFLFRKNEFIRVFTFVNFCIGAINILPVFPLDGGSVATAVLQSEFGIINAGRMRRKISYLICFFILSAIFCMMLVSRTNFSLCIIYLFLIYSMKTECEEAAIEKKLVLSGQVKCKKRVRYIFYDCESELLCIASKISPSYSLVALAFENDRFIGTLSQSEIISCIKYYGALATLKECIEKKNKLLYNKV